MAGSNIPPSENVVLSGGCHDCGGRCVHRIHVRDGKIIRIESDGGEEPQYRSCLRGRAYRQMVYSPDRLKSPMKRVGKRGEGNFEPISWDEALDAVARELKRVKSTCGPASILLISGTGSQGLLHAREAMEKLLNLFGGCTRKWGSASSEGRRFASKATYGTLITGHSRDDLVNSRLIIMWAWNPAVTILGTNTSYHLMQAKEAGARIVSIDPRLTDSGAVASDEWIPIIPGTDVAMMLAMAYVMITENLQDQAFLDRYTVGFDRFRDYVLGAEDGLPKTPLWAAAITGVPALTIERLARDFARIRPAALMCGHGPGRTAHGEQFHRAATVLAAMTGNIGIHGGNPVGQEYTHAPFRPPTGKNPAEAGAPSSLENSFDSALKSNFRVHSTKIWDAILTGRSGGYPADYKLVYFTCTNPIGSGLNLNKGIRALEKPEFIVVQDIFLTPTARFADIVLPVSTHLERNDIYRSLYPGPYYLFANRAIDPQYESKSEYQIAAELASRLGITSYPCETEDGLLRGLIRTSGDMEKNIADYDRFKQEGIQRIRVDEPIVAFKAQIEDPANNPFPTPSGKIEIYSQQIAELGYPELPPIPKYFESWEGRNAPLAKKYPLQLISAHNKRRANSAFDNVAWLKEVEPHAALMNTADAQARNVKDGDRVRVFNDRGELTILARVTERIMPGVVDIGNGAWYSPDENGVDTGGCASILIGDEASPGGAFCSNTCLVQVEKA